MDLGFEPTPWPEDKPPKEAESYTKCEICTDRSRLIWGEGNPSAPVFIILDNPGAREDKDGKAYVCGTRQTLQTVLSGVNISPKDVYLTYLLKCRPLRKYDKERARAFSKPFLAKQIDSAGPRYLVCLGDVVVQSMFEDGDIGVKDLRGKWQTLMGYPCMVSYHPLAVRRRPNLMKLFIEDWEMVAEKLRYNKFIIRSGTNR